MVYDNADAERQRLSWSASLHDNNHEVSHWLAARSLNEVSHFALCQSISERTKALKRSLESKRAQSQKTPARAPKKRRKTASKKKKSDERTAPARVIRKGKRPRETKKQKDNNRAKERMTQQPTNSTSVHPCEAIAQAAPGVSGEYVTTSGVSTTSNGAASNSSLISVQTASQSANSADYLSMNNLVCLCYITRDLILTVTHCIL